MTRVGIKEYVDALRRRCSRSSKKEKGEVLDEFVRVVGVTASLPSGFWGTRRR